MTVGAKHVVLDLRTNHRGALHVRNGLRRGGGRRWSLHQERQVHVRHRRRVKSGIRISASRMEPLKGRTAIIQRRLRVRILPVGFEGGVFKHGLPPCGTIQPRQPGGFLKAQALVRAAHLPCAARTLSWRTAAATLRRQRLRPSDRPGQNHCACVDTGDSESVPARKCECSVIVASLKLAP